MWGETHTWYSVQCPNDRFGIGLGRVLGVLGIGVVLLLHAGLPGGIHDGLVNSSPDKATGRAVFGEVGEEWDRGKERLG